MEKGLNMAQHVFALSLLVSTFGSEMPQIDNISG